MNQSGGSGPADDAHIETAARAWLDCRFSLRWASRHPPGRRRHSDRTDHHSIWWSPRGTCTIDILDARVELLPGQAVLLPPFLVRAEESGPSTVRATAEDRILGFGFSLTMPAGTAHPLSGLALPYVWTPDATLWPVLFEALVALQPVRADCDRRCRSQPLAAHLAWLATAAAAAGTPRQCAPAPSWLRTVRDRLDRAMQGAPPLTGLAELAGVSVTHLVRRFRAVYGCTPIAWNRRVRLEQAARLLLDLPDEGIREIAARCGYRDLDAFSAAFRRQHGLAPRSFRARRFADG